MGLKNLDITYHVSKKSKKSAGKPKSKKRLKQKGRVVYRNMRCERCVRVLRKGEGKKKSQKKNQSLLHSSRQNDPYAGYSDW